MKAYTKIVATLLVSASLTACSSKQTTQTSQSLPVESVVKSETISTEQTQGTYNIDMSNFKFSVDKIEASAGDTITINLKNSEGNHDLVIDELDLHSLHLGQGQTETLTFTIPETASGKTFEFYCSVGRHRQMGMVGELIVN